MSQGLCGAKSSILICTCLRNLSPWIAEDPDCPMHGTEAQRTRANTEDHIAQLQERISQLEESVSLQEEIICSLTRQVAQIVDNL